MQETRGALGSQSVKVGNQPQSLVVRRSNTIHSSIIIVNRIIDNNTAMSKERRRQCVELRGIAVGDGDQQRRRCHGNIRIRRRQLAMQAQRQRLVGTTTHQLQR